MRARVYWRRKNDPFGTMIARQKINLGIAETFPGEPAEYRRGSGEQDN